MVSASNPLAWGPCLSFPVRLSINDAQELVRFIPLSASPNALNRYSPFPPDMAFSGSCALVPFVK
jgi:hypothetical protein